MTVSTFFHTKSWPDATHPRSAGGAGHTRHCRPSPGDQRPTHHPPRVSAAALAIRLSLDVSAAGLAILYLDVSSAGLAILSLDVSATAPAITSVPGRASLGEEGATAGWSWRRYTFLGTSSLVRFLQMASSTAFSCFICISSSRREVDGFLVTGRGTGVGLAVVAAAAAAAAGAAGVAPEPTAGTWRAQGGGRC